MTRWSEARKEFHKHHDIFDMRMLHYLVMIDNYTLYKWGLNYPHYEVELMKDDLKDWKKRGVISEKQIEDFTAMTTAMEYVEWRGIGYNGLCLLFGINRSSSQKWNVNIYDIESFKNTKIKFDHIRWSRIAKFIRVVSFGLFYKETAEIRRTRTKTP